VATTIACALSSSGGTVTNQDLLDAAWSKPGYRGAFVSSQPEAVQASMVMGAPNAPF
jgi:hypothetical protein